MSDNLYESDLKNRRNPYINTEDQPQLKKSIIAFIDVLGFKELVQNAITQGNSQEVFFNFYQVLSTWFTRINGLHDEIFDMPFIGGKNDRYKIRIFTDCVVIGCPISKDGGNNNFIEGRHEFFDMLSMLYLFQLEMVNQGYFVRGAIAVDDLYMDDIIIYGNGVIEAYEAESRQAKYPRIILTESAKNALEEIIKSFEDKKFDNYLSSYLYKDKDGYLFINYLESIKIGDHSFQFVDELQKHKKIIESKLVKYQGKPHFLEKYIWAANYHNFFCEQPPCYNEYKIDLSNYQIQPV